MTSKPTLSTDNATMSELLFLSSLIATTCRIFLSKNCERKWIYFLISHVSIVLPHPGKSRIITHVLHVLHLQKSRNFLLFDRHNKIFLPGLGLSIEIHGRYILILVGASRSCPLSTVGRVLSTVGILRVIHRGIQRTRDPTKNIPSNLPHPRELLRIPEVR